MKQNVLPLLYRAAGFWIKGRIHFSADSGVSGIEDRGESFATFRKVTVDPAKDSSGSNGAIFRVRFTFKNLPIWANRLLSLIPIPLIVAQPGFRSKTWLLGENSGDFMGYYEFESMETAKAYWDSLPLRMMRKRARDGSLSHDVIDCCPINPIHH